MAASLSEAGFLIGLLLLSPDSVFVSVAVLGHFWLVQYLGMPFTSTVLPMMLVIPGGIFMACTANPPRGSEWMWRAASTVTRSVTNTPDFRTST